MAAAIESVGKKRLTGIFATGDSAERAYQVCVDRGHAIGDVNVVISERTRKELRLDGDPVKAEMAERKSEGAQLGGPSGGRTGILVTIFAAVGTAVALPALGFLAGPVAIALAAAGTAGATAGLIALFSDWGIPPDELDRYAADVREGAILIAVEAGSDGEAREIAKEWKALGGRDVRYH
jgi:hypothetical protein